MFFNFVACLPNLNGPAVLATGVGRPNGLSLTAQDTLMVGSHDGLYFVDYHGQVSADAALEGVNVLSVASHPDRYYLLTEDGFAWRNVSEENWHWIKPQMKARKILSWKSGTVLLVGKNTILEWGTKGGMLTPWDIKIDGIHDVTYDTTDGCDGILVASKNGIDRVCDDRQERLSSVFVEHLASSKDYVWGIRDERLGLVGDATLNETRFFPAKAVVFGGNTLFPEHMLYGVMESTVELTQCLPE